MKPIRGFFIALTALISMSAAAVAQDAPAKIDGAKTVDAQAIFDLVAATPNLVILDNRKEEDFAAGHIEGAVRLIDTDVDAESLAKHISGKSAPVLFYCNGVKCGRAAKAAERAVHLGYTKVYYYALGMEEWNAKNLPLVR